VRDFPSVRSGTSHIRLIRIALASFGCAIAAVPALAQADLAGATRKLTLQVAIAILGEKCRRIEAPNPDSLASVSLHRTFHDDFDAHPLLDKRWAPHYAGGAAWPVALYFAYQIDER
jgi:hypothetical protein